MSEVRLNMEKKSGEEDERAMLVLDRASRATRGKRLTKLLDDELEQDDLFWNQDALKDDEEDDNYQEEAEVADEFDSDFDEDEPEPDAEQPQNDDEEKMHKKKRLIFPGKTLAKKKKKKKKIESTMEKDKNDDDDDDEKSIAAEEHHDDAGEKIIRKSTRTSVIVRQAERDAIRAALQATAKPVKRKKEGEDRKMSQEEMLLEAAQTEIMNKRNLERVLAREEEVKRRAIVHKNVYNGPQIRFISKNGCSYLEFLKGASFHTDIATKSDEYPEQPVCVITGLPAKYRDPKTRLPYATKEAFKIIQQRFLDENANSRKDVSMGGLYDSVSGCSFSTRQKRSSKSDKNIHSQDRSFARFRRFPDSEDEDSD